MKVNKSNIAYLVSLIAFLWQGLNAMAQVTEQVGVGITRDSVQLDETASLLYNSVSLTNKNNSPLNLTLSISCPKGWRLLNNHLLEITLASNEKQVLPLTLVRLPDAVAQWMPVSLKLSLQKQHSSAIYTYHVKAPVINRFFITPVTTSVQFTREVPEQYQAVLRIRNSGTTTGKYLLEYKSEGLNILDKVSLELPPDRDTVYIHHFKAPAAQWKDLANEKIFVNVADTTGTTYNYIINLQRYRHSVKMHASPYETFPLEVESGLMMLDKQKSYFAAVKGALKLKDNRIDFFYRTRQLGMSNSIENNYYGVDFNSKHWELYAGQMTDIKNFFTNGRGGKIAYKWKDGGEVNLAGTLHSNAVFPNDNVSSTVKYKVRKLAFSHALAANFDAAQGVKSYLLKNDFELFHKKQFSLSVNGGLGFDERKRASGSWQNLKAGPAMGYNLAYTFKKWHLSSIAQHNSDWYPGMDRGLHYQFQDLRWQNKGLSFNIFYQNNRSIPNILRDTVYNSDAFENNMKRWGMGTGWGNQRNTVFLNAGWMSQTAQLLSALPRYHFVELGYSYRTPANFLISLNSINGYHESYGYDRSKIWLTRTNLSMGFKNGGIRGFYMQNPMLDAVDPYKVTGYTKSLFIAPYLNFSIGKHLQSSVSYNTSKSIYDNTTTNSVSFNLTYNHAGKNMYLDIYGMVPVKYSNANVVGLNSRFINVSLRKTLNVPLLARKKFHNLRVVAFNDANNNGKKDAEEERLKNVLVTIHNTPFLTDDKGEVAYQNMDGGAYALDVQQLKAIKGLAPTLNNKQVTVKEKDQLVEVAFKKSKVISGVVTITLDSLSYTSFTPGDIKVMATDATGKVFSVLTNEAGEFYLNVPSDVYVVSLNPEAFNEKMKPVVMSYTVDLTEREEAVVNFEIKQKKREIRFIKNK